MQITPVASGHISPETAPFHLNFSGMQLSRTFICLHPNFISDIQRSHNNLKCRISLIVLFNRIYMLHKVFLTLLANTAILTGVLFFKPKVHILNDGTSSLGVSNVMVFYSAKYIITVDIKTIKNGMCFCIHFSLSRVWTGE